MPTERRQQDVRGAGSRGAGSRPGGYLYWTYQTVSRDRAKQANATITGVTVTVEWKVSTAASIATLGAGATVNGTPVGTELVNAAEPTADTSQSFAIPGLTRAQLLNGTFGVRVRVRATRGYNNTAFTASLDAVSVKVDYTSANVTAISVNAAGATTTRGADTFTYDQANRLRTAAVAGTTETSTYDGDGVRFSRQVGAGPVIRAVTDPTAGLPVTIDDGTRKYVWGLGLAYAVAGTAIEVQHADRLGSIRAVTDGTGAVTATFRTDEFGVPTASTGSAGSPFRYTGEPLDASGLTYLRARHYDASIGRFMTRDTWPGVGMAPSSLHRFAYVGNNPVTLSDRSGHCVDPGGPGLRYCVDRFIPNAEALFGSVGDNRGPNSAGGSFRIRQFVYQLENGTTAYESIAGTTEVNWWFVHLDRAGRLSKCDAMAKKSNTLGGRDVVVSCLGGHGVLWWFPGVPEIHHLVQIHETEDGQATVVAAIGTSFPSMEVWQYGGPAGPQLVYFADATDNSEWDLYSPGVLVPQ